VGPNRGHQSNRNQQERNSHQKACPMEKKN
jgi:hypothetical protein